MDNKLLNIVQSIGTVINNLINYIIFSARGIDAYSTATASYNK
jgi:hypothetical protein